MQLVVSKNWIKNSAFLMLICERQLVTFCVNALSVFLWLLRERERWKSLVNVPPISNGSDKCGMRLELVEQLYNAVNNCLCNCKQQGRRFSHHFVRDPLSKRSRSGIIQNRECKWSRISIDIQDRVAHPMTEVAVQSNLHSIQQFIS